MSGVIDTEYMANITCPYCGRVNWASWEYSESDTEYECGYCGRTSKLSVHVHTCYTTEKQETEQ